MLLFMQDLFISLAILYVSVFFLNVADEVARSKTEDDRREIAKRKAQQDRARFATQARAKGCGGPSLERVGERRRRPLKASAPEVKDTHGNLLPLELLIETMTCGLPRPKPRKGKKKVEAEEDTHDEDEVEQVGLEEELGMSELEETEALAALERELAEEIGVMSQEKRDSIWERHIKSMNKATLRKYGTNVWHFLTWCEHEGIHPFPDTDKLLYYLDFRIENKVPGHNETRAITNRQTFRGVKFSLDNAQKMLRLRYGLDFGRGVNEDAVCKALTAQVALLEQEHVRSSNVDPQKNTMGDTLTQVEFERCIHYLDVKGLERNPVKYNSLMKTMRQALYRGDDARHARISDLFLIDMDREAIGPDLCKCLCILSKEGKHNQLSRSEYGFLFRARSPDACAIGALALWFYYRWHVDGEEAIDFFDEKWTDIRIWPATAEETSKQMSPKTQSKYIQAVFKFCKVATIDTYMSLAFD